MVASHSAKADRPLPFFLPFVIQGHVQIFCNSLMAHFSRLHAESLKHLIHFLLCNSNLFNFFLKILFFSCEGVKLEGGGEGAGKGKGTLSNEQKRWTNRKWFCAHA